MSRYKILALFGESGSGKDSILNWILSNIPNTHKIINHTSRPIRENEKDGIDYYYVDKNYFIDNMRDMLTLNIFNGWYYGTSVKELQKDKINVGVFSPNALDQLYECADYEGNVDIYPIQILAGEKERLLRALNREEYPNCAEICRRFLSDIEDFKDIDIDESAIYINSSGRPFDDIKTILGRYGLI